MLRRLALAACALTGVPLVIAWIISQNVLHPRRRTEDHRLDDFDLPAGDVSFQSRDGTALAGWFIPANVSSGRSPAIVLAHGWARSRAELLPHAAFLHRAGYALIAFDFRHRGESAGDAVTMGVKERGDLQGALDLLCARPEVDPKRVGIFGMSLGGAVALLVAADDPRVRALAVEAPFAGHDAIMVRALRHYYHLPSFPFADLAKVVIQWRIGESLDPVQPERAVGRISPRPLFVIAGGRDAVVGKEQAERVFAAAGEPKRYWLIDDADHARGWQAAQDEYERRLVAFFHDALAGPAPQAAPAASSATSRQPQ